ncbi:DUF502 domain-containing protein [Hymenobacter busanensis]|uniref:DUF502 domain-containing protein n=1 Tax=Hymenobacter busanensis TaxID=2607656 RepID=A0A7L4ZVS1_9BACT|nr:DUF502 domain-containing protein [Hymenobacter busanensis]KAA9332127.1 DUF502 domain-containing protein [Hymenobacter busanensis]QHJ07534.1 DUF502 domain-containing protein [Hymenobacter busanensis]
MKKIIGYFLRGLLILAPVTITVYLLFAFFNWINGMFVIDGYPGLGLALMVALLTLMGYIGSQVRPFIVLGERILNRLPVVNIIYSSIKDIFDAILGEEQKFNTPVLVKVFAGTECYKLGFITQESMEAVNRPDLVAVYFPDSYNFSGELLLVPRENVLHVDLPSAQVMKFVVSGGVARL